MSETGQAKASTVDLGDTWGKAVEARPGRGLYSESLLALANEVRAGREKFPGTRFMLAAATEELGEVARALLQKQGKERVRKEALQLAATAMRIYEEGDASFADITDAEALP